MKRPHLCVATAAALLASCVARPPPPLPIAAQCLAALDQRGVRYAVAAMKASLSSCAVDDAVLVSATTIAWSRPSIVSCGFALTLDDFARDAIQPLARAQLGRSVRLIRHFGTYACRSTRGGRESLHAVGEAIDIAGFELEDGTVISVEQDWHRPGARSAFLHAIARAACARFSQVLTPDSDRDHFNHIHLDSGPYRHCGVHAGLP